MNRLFFGLCFLLSQSLASYAQQQALHPTATLPFSGVRFSEMEKTMIRQGLINVKYWIPDAILDIRYATDNNFLHVNVYGDYNKCYLQPDVVKKLQKADSLLKVTKPNWKFVMYDCARPVSVQVKMWDVLKMPAAEKGKYVSNPKNLSVHNLGAAVDIALADEQGKYLDMGTEFDYFGDLAYPFMESTLVQQGKLTQTQVENRKILRAAMKGAGFSNVPYEWWHFNAYSRNLAREKYGRID